MLTATFSSDTVTDSSPFDAVRRSARWYTPMAAAKLLASQPTGPVGAQWLTWTRHKASTTVTVRYEPEGPPPATPTRSYDQYEVIQAPHGAHGWKGKPNLYICFATLSRTAPSAPWEVASLETTAS